MVKTEKKETYYQTGDGEEIEFLLHSHDVGYCCKCREAIDGNEISAERGDRWIRKKEPPICRRCRKFRSQFRKFIIVSSSIISVVLFTFLIGYKYFQSRNKEIDIDYPTFAGIQWTTSKTTASLRMRGRGYTLVSEDPITQTYRAELVGAMTEVTFIYNDQPQTLEMVCVEIGKLQILDREKIDDIYNQILVTLQNNYGVPSSQTQTILLDTTKTGASWIETKGKSYPAPYLSIRLVTDDVKNSLLLTYLSPSETQIYRERKTKNIQEARLESKIDDF